MDGVIESLLGGIGVCEFSFVGDGIVFVDGIRGEQEAKNTNTAVMNFVFIDEYLFSGFKAFNCHMMTIKI